MYSSELTNLSTIRKDNDGWFLGLSKRINTIIFSPEKAIFMPMRIKVKEHIANMKEDVY